MFINLFNHFFAVFYAIYFSCQYTKASPRRYPCRHGAQQLSQLLSSYVPTFVESVNHTEKIVVCNNVIEDVKSMKIFLNSMDKCENGGGTRIIGVINDQLTEEKKKGFSASSSNIQFGKHLLTKNSFLTTDKLEICAYSLSFIRSIFNLGVESLNYLQLETTASKANIKIFKEQIKQIDSICNKFQIGINVNVYFEAPWGNKIVPLLPQMVNNYSDYSLSLEPSQFRDELGSSDEEI